MLLCDIGNTFYHFWHDGRRLDIAVGAVLPQWSETCYTASVNAAALARLEEVAPVVDLGSWIELDGSYEGMGIDRQLVCLAVQNGVVVDAGSAVTIDVVKDGRFIGGYIVPGFGSLRPAFAAISPVLDIPLDFATRHEGYPRSTREALSRGMTDAVGALVRDIAARYALPIIVTGGDAGVLTASVPEAQRREGLVFEGMKNVLTKKGVSC